MRTVFLLFSFSLLLLSELFFGRIGVFFPLVWFGCFYFGSRDGLVPAAAASMFFGALAWGLCGRDMMFGMLAALFFAAWGRGLREWRSSGLFHLCCGGLIFCIGGAGALWFSSALRGALEKEWGLLTAQTVFWAAAGIFVSSVLCSMMNRISTQIGAGQESGRRKGVPSWRA